MTARKTFQGKLLVRLQGPLLIGGHTPPAAFLDARTARDRQSSPIIPSSTLKGALREACTRLAHARGASAACTPDAPCNDCLVCELFGAPGPDRPGVVDGTGADAPSGREGRAGGIVIGDGTPRDHRVTYFAARQGVGIDRKLGAATPEVLYQREAYDAPGQELTASLRGAVSAQAFELLVSALQIVDGLGNSRSRGFGQISVEWVPDEVADGPKTGIARRMTRPTAGAVLRIKPLAPLILGAMPDGSNVMRSLTYIPGSSIRGALAWALVRAGCSPDDPSFRGAFVDTDTCLRFSDAYLAKRESDRLPLPRPVSTLRCKHDRDDAHRRHYAANRDSRSEKDMLLLWMLAARLLDSGGRWEHPTCPVCEDALRGSEGLLDAPRLERRIVTRLCRDIRTSSAMQGMLYSIEQIEPSPDHRFCASVSGLTQQALDLLGRFPDLQVHIGKNRTRGFGRVSLELEERSSDIERRLEGFAAVAGKLAGVATECGAADLPSDGARLLSVLARTDLALPPERAGDEIGREVFGAGDGWRLLASYQTTGVRSGWDAVDGRSCGPRPMRPVVRAGSAWLFGCDAPPPLATLDRLEIEGVGWGTWLGMGQIVFDPDVFWKGVQA